MSFTHAQLKPFVQAKWIGAQRHPSLPLTIYNYTPSCQYAKHWTPETLVSRGLILDDDDNIVARPFPKFFNDGERGERPDGRWNAYEKADGSLFIVARYNDEIVTATRGSFMSSQAQLGRLILFQQPIDWLQAGTTYCFELIHPENRIVVDYGQRRDLILLAVRETHSGFDYLDQFPEGHFPFPVCKPLTFWEVMESFRDPASQANREGLVLHFPDAGTRLKVKFPDYVRLHRLMTNCSSVTIWEHLGQGRELEELIENVPDEFYDWARTVADELSANYHGIYQAAWLEFREIEQLGGDRKEFAIEAIKRQHPPLLFALLDGRDLNAMIWKLIKPVRTLPFRAEAP